MKSLRPKPATSALAMMAALLTLPVGTAQADDALQFPAYIGGGIGGSAFTDIAPSNADIDAALLKAGIRSDTDFDINSFMWRAFVGIHFHENFAVEVGYADYGRVDVDINLSSTNTITGGSTDGEINAIGYTVHGIGIVPITEKLSFLGKAGVVFWDVDSNIYLKSTTGNYRLDNAEEDASLAFGVGAEYRMTRQIGFRADYDYISEVGDFTLTGEADINTVTGNLVFHFE
ncbi:MAG: outer membrane beta-barrel protein [Magnetococcales bacterium]|nr:outer membrane beta-barrel protein [Magnetococcales bacterium]